MKDTNTQEFSNKTPTYSKEYNCYVLNYINRRIKTSVKNFQLVGDSFPQKEKSKTKNEKEDILLQFGEARENIFIIDYKYPFSPIKAFGIGISCIQNKKLCE